MHEPAPHTAEILFRDSGLLALNKPAGIPVHGSRMLEDQPVTLLQLARRHEGTPIHAVHRLDRPVSGVNLLTPDRELLVYLSQQFEQRKVKKNYLAVARGWTEDSGTIDHPLLPPRDERKTNSVAREAVTHFKRLARVETPYPVAPYDTSRYSLVLLSPETGRRHQLRRHMKHISHHLVGDTTYGRGEHNRLFRERFDCHRLLLHSWSLEFEHPENARPVRIEAPLDDAFNRVIEAFEWEEAMKCP
jgi:tRNA pseudouridine65 synthase